MPPRWRRVAKRPGGTFISGYPGQMATRTLCFALLAAVSCPTTAFCIAVGEYATFTATKPMAARWSGLGVAEPSASCPRSHRRRRPRR